MGHCPYCGAEMPEEAATCPRCRSYMSEDSGRRFRPLPGIFHPAVTLAIIILVSGALLAADLLYEGPQGPGKEPVAAGSGGDDDKSGKSASDERKADRGKDRDRGRGQGGRRGRADKGPEAGGTQYSRVLTYESKVMEILDRVDNTSMEMDELKDKHDKDSVRKMGEKIKELHDLQREIRGLSTMPQLQYAHNHLARFVSQLHRTYRRYMIYMQSREKRQLRLAEQDMTRAEKLRQSGLSELEAQKKRLAPEPPPAPKQPEPEPVEADTAGPSDKESQQTPPSEDDRYEEEGYEEDGTFPGDTFPEGDSVYYEEGGTVYYDEGGTVYYDDGSTVYYEDGATVYYEDESTVYPEEGGTVYYDEGHEQAPGGGGFGPRY